MSEHRYYKNKSSAIFPYRTAQLTRDSPLGLVMVRVNLAVFSSHTKPKIFFREMNRRVISTIVDLIKNLSEQYSPNSGLRRIRRQ
ncbi:hypothetical protein ElyMa_000703700 [Elysia marginata]|uniref:Uncharacterized protein n=1 Tax=Elysia marginata TaxID=1093978 RepID=A0AAV4GJ12_9GAST|nr:hypothetical protein ElyMa_000703700 [Elysia marginata]